MPSSCTQGRAHGRRPDRTLQGLHGSRQEPGACPGPALSPLLARGIAPGIGAYMRLPALQPLLLRPVPRLQRPLKIESRFEARPPPGR